MAQTVNLEEILRLLIYLLIDDLFRRFYGSKGEKKRRLILSGNNLDKKGGFESLFKKIRVKNGLVMMLVQNLACKALNCRQASLDYHLFSFLRV